MNSIIGFLIVTLLIFKAHSLETSYLKFQEPAGWQCNQENSIWICKSADNKIGKQAYLIVKAKLAGKSENIETLFEYLSKPIPINQALAKNIYSKVIMSEIQNVQNKKWVVARHLHSVLDNYYSDYLTTVVGDLAISIEINYHENGSELFKNIQSQILNEVLIKESLVTQIQKTEDRGVANPPPSLDGLNLNENSEPPIARNIWLYVIIGLVIIILGWVIKVK